MILKNRFTAFGAALLVAAVAVSASACKKPAPPAPPPVAQAPAPAPVAAVQMGTAIGSDNRVTAATTAFRPTDTIYLSVTTQGEQGGKALAARFTYGDAAQVVHESTQALPAGANVVTEFHIAKPDGFPPGSYSATVTLDGRQVASQAFTVQ